ncbi:MAG TPA: hypothetical protein PLF35_13070 [Prolixibacteraceae bacterium]|nr:hypothetical protein [Prolixibacteraceae bacterium]
MGAYRSAAHSAHRQGPVSQACPWWLPLVAPCQALNMAFAGGRLTASARPWGRTLIDGLMG